MSRKCCVAVLAMFVSMSMVMAQGQTVSCVGNFNLSLNDCETTITPEMISAGPLIVGLDYTVTLRDEHGDLLPSTPNVTGDLKGQEIAYTLRIGPEASGGNSCWGVLIIEDKIAPVIEGCETGERDLPMLVNCFNLEDIDFSSLIEDNCDPNPDIVILDEVPSPDICQGNILKEIVRTIRAVDNCDNESPPCAITIQVERVPLVFYEENAVPGIVAPEDDFVVACELVNATEFPENLDFNGNPNPVTLTGVPMFQDIDGNQFPLFPIDESLHCKINVVYTDEVLIDNGCFTKIIRNWLILDECSDVPFEFTQNISIMDLEAPTISNVPVKLNLSTNTGANQVCAAITPVPIPTLADNCQDQPTLFVSINGLPMIQYTGQPLTFPEGQNTLIYIGVDGCLNTLTGEPNEVRDTVDVWVQDNAPPVCNIESKGITLNNDTGTNKVPATLFDNGSFDDCSKDAVQIFARRLDDNCMCTEQDAEKRYDTNFVYLGRRNGSDYYLSDNELTAPKALNLAVAMGGFVASSENARERDFIRQQVEDYIARFGISELTYFITRDDQEFPSSLGWDPNQGEFDFVMGTTGVTLLQPFDGLNVEKRFIVEVTDLCGFSENIRFCCDDVLTSPTVEFRVVDAWGNFNTCELVVDIQDKVGPAILCPDVEIICSDFTQGMDLSVFGDPVSNDVCPAIITELDPDLSGIDPVCNTGEIIRNFRIESGTGIDECQQIITIGTVPIEDLEDPIDPLDINLPEDGPLLGLDDDDLLCFEDLTLLNPDDLPIEFSPQFTDNRVCSNLAITFEDEVFEVPGAGPNTCFKVVRRWTIFDPCLEVVVYTHDQSIVISNTVAPTVTFTNAPDEICNEFEASNFCPSEDFDVSFEVEDDCTDDADLEVTFFLDLNCNGTFEEMGPVTLMGAIGTVSFSDMDLTIDVPVGTHKIIIETVDACNNVGTNTHTFEIINCVDPTAACQALTTPLHCFPEPPTSPINFDGMVDSGPFDCDDDGMISEDEQELFFFQCAQAAWFVPTEDAKLHPCDLPVVISFSADTTDVERCFTCADLRCPQEVTIFITDEFGNSDMCVSTITLTDPKGLCPPLPDCIIPPMVTTADLDDICLSGAALPEDLSSFGVDAPTIDETCCNDPNNSIEFEDQELADNADGCRVIRRTYTVTTDCGCPIVEEFVQTITVRNDEAPSMVCPANQTVEANRVNCTFAINLAPVMAGDNCQTTLPLTITNNLSDAFPANAVNNDNGNLPNINFPLGTTRIVFTATNDCDLSNTCVTVINVEDTTPPVLDCQEEVDVPLTNMEVILSSGDLLELLFVSDPTDICGIDTIMVDPPTLDCDNVDTPVEVTITVIDVNGNESECTVDVTAVDDVPPTIDCPDDLTVNVNNTDDCVWVADTSVDADAMFNCDFDILHDVEGPGMQITGGEGGSIAGTVLQLGTHTVTYTLTNGMQTIDCEFDITVVDNQAPMITCPDNEVLPVNQNCMVTIPLVRYRRSVGITNNCTSSIGLADLDFLPNITTLSGHNTMQTFTFNALDDDGNIVATCMFDVTTEDRIDPTPNCPASGMMMADAIEGDCRPRIPQFRGTDNCDGQLQELVNDGPGPRVFQVPRAGRIWDGVSDVVVTAVDAAGNRESCTVMLTAVCPGEENAPIFTTTNGDILGANGMGIESNDNCELDITSPFVVDYCLPTDLVASAVVTAGPSTGLVLPIQNNGIAGTSVSFVVTGTLPIGMHTITVTAEDPDCVSTTDEFDVLIFPSGGEPAGFECKKIVRPIGADGTVTFLASEIVCSTGGSACDGSNPTLLAAFSNDPTDISRTFDCSDLNPGNAIGTDIQVTMFIFDVTADGPVFREPCFVIQTITDPNGVCTFFSSSALNVGGRIFTEDNEGIENSEISLIGQEDIQTSNTEEFGLYAFPSMPVGGSYTVTPSKDDNYNNGVSTLDIILIQKHILGIQELDSPYKLIAADVNASGSLTALDLLEMRKVILGLEEGFERVPSWQMINTEYQFIDPENPYADTYPDTYTIASLEQNMFIDFIGVKMGDVNLSADPMRLVSAETRTSDVDMNFEMQPIVNGSELIYDFSTAQFTDIEGFQFTLNFDADRLRFDGINGSLLDIDEENIGIQLIDEGIITFSYDKIGGIAVSSDEVLFSLKFEHNGNLNSDVSINSSVVSAQLYSPENVYDLGGQVIASDTDIVLYQNTPNPWTESTEIGFMLPMEMQYELKFYTVSGQLLHTVERNGVAGLNSVNVYNDDINSNGLIYYELITPNEKTTRRMILLN